MSSGFAVSKEGKKLEPAGKARCTIVASKKKAHLVLEAKWNEPGTYELDLGDLRNRFCEGIAPAKQIKIKKRIDEAVDRLMNPTIVHPSFETAPVFVPPPAPMFFQPPPMMEPPAPPMIFFQPPPMMGPPAPPMMFFQPPPMMGPPAPPMMFFQPPPFQ